MAAVGSAAWIQRQLYEANAGTWGWGIWRKRWCLTQSWRAFEGGSCRVILLGSVDKQPWRAEDYLTPVDHHALALAGLLPNDEVRVPLHQIAATDVREIAKEARDARTFLDRLLRTGRGTDHVPVTRDIGYHYPK